MPRLLLVTALALALLVGVLALRTLAFVPPELEPAPKVSFDVDGKSVARHLSQAIQLHTVSRQQPPHRDPAAFEQFIAWLERTYPGVHGALARRRIAGYSLLYEWRGRDPSLAPIFITAHYDVVPVLPDTEELWEHDPFGGRVEDGHVWGRGALDDKGALISILEGVTLLLRAGFEPQRTVYLAFGHDEELGGREGAASITRQLQGEGVRLAWTLDEGSFLMRGMSPGVEVPVALISVAEKGSVTLDLVARADGGHSSMPPRHTAVGVLAEAIVRIETSPLPGGLDGVSEAMFAGIARHSSLGIRLLFANRWLFGGLLERLLARNPIGNAMMRTTTAATMVSGSDKENVLPIEARAKVNFRLHPRDSAEDVLDHVRGAVDDDRVEVSLGGGVRREASAVSSTDAQGYLDIASATRQVFGDVVVVPGLTVAGTDSHHYHQAAADSYRYHPMVLTPDDTTRVHGTNERVSVQNLVAAVSFYARLIELSAGE